MISRRIFAMGSLGLMSLLAMLTACNTRFSVSDELYQNASIAPLLEGAYDGTTTIAQLRRHGNFGIGTFNRLDGEMVVLEGRFFQVRSDGKVYPVADDRQTPFATIVFFDDDKSFRINERVDLKGLTEAIDRRLPSRDLFYAIRIDGEFARVRTRSVPAQSKPYPRLIEVARQQPEFELEKVRGTLVGFRLPASVEGVNVPGYHLHFLAADRQSGGHLLALEGSNLKVRIDVMRRGAIGMHQEDGAKGVSPEQRQRELEEIE